LAKHKAVKTKSATTTFVVAFDMPKERKTPREAGLKYHSS
jgi:hypothetical protein